MTRGTRKPHEFEATTCLTLTVRTRYIGLLTGKGYKVLSVWRATREDMMVAHHNPRSAGVYIDAHGSAGKVRSVSYTHLTLPTSAVACGAGGGRGE